MEVQIIVQMIRLKKIFFKNEKNLLQTTTDSDIL
jgi:hypothetical protein